MGSGAPCVGGDLPPAGGENAGSMELRRDGDRDVRRRLRRARSSWSEGSRRARETRSYFATGQILVAAIGLLLAVA